MKADPKTLAVLLRAVSYALLYGLVTEPIRAFDEFVGRVEAKLQRTITPEELAVLFALWRHEPVTAATGLSPAPSQHTGEEVST